MLRALSEIQEEQDKPKTISRFQLYTLPLGDWEFHLNQIDGNDYHRCEEHQLVCIPLVLVVHLRLQEMIDGLKTDKWRILEPFPHFEPYWLIDVSIIHDWVPYPKRTHRSLNIIEAACLLAQHPYLGSVQSHEGLEWGHGRIQVYRSPETGRIIASRFGIPSYNHHKAFTTGVFGLDPPFVIRHS